MRFPISVTVLLLVPVTDTRIKSEVIDLALEDASVETTLITETDVISIYPPIPSVITYNIGVLRHFVFIRKADEIMH